MVTDSGGCGGPQEVGRRGSPSAAGGLCPGWGPWQFSPYPPPWDMWHYCSNCINGWVSPERELDRPSLADCLKRYGLPRRRRGKGLPTSVGGAGDAGSIPGGRRSPKTGNPRQCFCLKNPIDRGRATVHGQQKSRARLSECTHTQERYAGFIPTEVLYILFVVYLASQCLDL